MKTLRIIVDLIVLLILAILFAMAGVLVCTNPATGQTPARESDYKVQAKYATVRIISHGCSGTVIGTGEGYSWILSCAHQFLDRSNRPSSSLLVKKLVVDLVSRNRSEYKSPAKKTGVVLKAVKFDWDLSLILLRHGPVPYVAKVAPKGYKHSGKFLSAGHDRMHWPAIESVTCFNSYGRDVMYVDRKPWFGRSGGMLLDCKTGYLVGTVIGFDGRGRGIYTRHRNIVHFVQNWRNYPPPSNPRSSPRWRAPRLIPENC